jgi:hypothetical protein
MKGLTSLKDFGFSVIDSAFWGFLLKCRFDFTFPKIKKNQDNNIFNWRLQIPGKLEPFYEFYRSQGRLRIDLMKFFQKHRNRYLLGSMK